MKHTLYALFALILTTFSLQAQNITLEGIWSSSEFRGASVYGINSMNDGVHYTRLNYVSGGFTIVKYAYATGDSVATLLDTRNIDAKVNFSSIYSFSADESKVLLISGYEPIYRHSYKGLYFVYDLESKELSEVDSDPIMHATLSPAGNTIAFVKENNLFYRDLETEKTTQITFDGEYNKIINGSGDWVYEEEFVLVRAFEWSPDGKEIAFVRFNETEVPEFSMDMFQQGLYPSQYRFKYPKAGEKNSEVSLHVYNLKKNEVGNVDLSNYQSYYIPRITWAESGRVVATVMNRLQNHLQLVNVHTDDLNTDLLFEEKAEAYIEVNDYLTFTSNGDFIWVSEMDGYRHIYLYDENGNKIRQITDGEWEVTDVYGLDAKEKTIYFQAAATSPINREIYSVSIRGGKMRTLTSLMGTNRASFSKSKDYFINYYSNSNNPQEVTLLTSKGKVLRELEMNKEYKERLKKYNLSKVERFEFTTEENVDLTGYMIKPQDFDPNKTYPVFMFVYGGPGSQTTQNSWGGSNYFWFQMLAQQGYIVVSVDNRGTGARGRDFRTVTYQELGKYETEDQIATAKYLASLEYVDGERIGIFGWSYGGYMSSLCLTKGADYFKVAIAVAPVTNWRYYDTIYTERYMRTPQENESGYDDNSPINHVDKMRGSYLLVHGSADDNVHYQNTMEMVRQLVEADVEFDMFVYPDKNHGIYGGNTRLHLYRKMTNFILENL
jgi:dipeptidyl-peptidase-4